MDKLQPILKYHFWILAGLILPLVIYGYYSANGQLKAATEARVTTLKGVKDKISQGKEPNKDYVAKLSHINDFFSESVDDVIVDLWRHQQKRMVWPATVAAKVPAEFMGQFDQDVPFIYQGIYKDVILKLQEHVQPVRPLDPMARNRPASASSAPNQKVVLAANVPQASFGQFRITSDEMWNAQIDVWLTQLLFDAIVKMNEEKESVSEAIIRRIDVVELVGGTGSPSLTGGGGGGSGGEDPAMIGMAMGSGGMGGPKAPTTIAFSPAQEFGPASEGGGNYNPDMSAAESGAPAQATEKRYIAESDSAPYLERGFYLSVIIMQNKIADFVVTLANSDWPVRVVRFQVGANPYRKEQPVGDAAGPIGPFGGSSAEPSGEYAPALEGSAPNLGMGPMSGGFGRRGPVAPNPFASNLPEFATAAMNHPDLVQLDLCGAITMYKQPKEIIAAVNERKAKAAQQPPAVPAAPVGEAAPPAADPVPPPAEAAPATPATPDGSAPAPEGATPPPAAAPAVP